MLVRAYRLTDKLGVVILKSSVALTETMLAGIGMIWRRVVDVLLLIGGVLWFILRPLWALLSIVFGGIGGRFGRTSGRTMRAGKGRMAQRAARANARAEMEVGVVEDPLRAQNRALSGVAVVLLAVLVGVVLWATNPARTASSDVPPLDSALFAPQDVPPPTSAVILQSTPVPTTTPLPAILEARGSLAYVVREQGQTDIWAVSVGNRTPIRLATHEYKEDVKVGYNLQRKVVLMGIWAALPALLLLQPTLFGLMTPHDGWLSFARNLGMIWLVLGVAGVIFRMMQLFLQKDLQAGFVWATKILTDPFHDIKLYYKAPVRLLKGELIDPEIASEHAAH